MKRVGVVLFVSILLALSIPSVQVQGQVIPDRYIVVLSDYANPEAVAQDLAARHGLIIGHIYRAALNGFSAYIPAARLDTLRTDPRVRLVEPDLVVHAVQSTQGRAHYGSQPSQVIPKGIDRIDAELSSVARINGVDERVNVDIAIIDTGISKTHPDLNWYNGVTIRGVGKAGGDDDNGHGSHVAGTAAAIDNGIGVVGVAPGARLWSVKVLNKNGSGSLSGVIAGIDYVTQRASLIEVANMSLGAVGKSDSFQLAIHNSVAAGVFYAVAAGNGGADVYGADGQLGTTDDSIPAAYPEVAAVSAIADSDGQPGGIGVPTSWGYDDTFAIFSNFSRSVTASNPVASPGKAIDLAAPGVDILSTWKGTGYAVLSGTSMASPHVCGAAALYIAAHGKPVNTAGVVAVRQALINAGFAQSSAEGFSGDPDSNPEPLVNAAVP